MNKPLRIKLLPYQAQQFAAQAQSMRDALSKDHIVPLTKEQKTQHIQQCKQALIRMTVQQAQALLKQVNE